MDSILERINSFKAHTILGILFVVFLVVFGASGLLLTIFKNISAKSSQPENALNLPTMVAKTLAVYQNNPGIIPVMIPTITPVNPTSTPITTSTPIVTQTNTHTPIATLNILTALPLVFTDTPNPTHTPSFSFTLLTPENGSNLPAAGFIRFSWTKLGTSKYKLIIYPPNKPALTYSSIFPLYDRYLESMPKEGEYHWEVIALDQKDKVVGNAGPFTFTKTQGKPVVQAAQN